MSKKPENVIQWIYSSKNNTELAERYDEWAGSYDKDLHTDFGWLSPRRAVDAFAKRVPRHARVLDAGAGTGIVGELLHEVGFEYLIAMDLSQGMLDEAARKHVYKEFHRMAMGSPLDFPPGSFDGVISVGVFTVGHAPPGSFDELVRVTRPGGHIVFSLRPDTYEQDGFREKQSSLEAEGKWRLVEEGEKYPPMPKGGARGLPSGVDVPGPVTAIRGRKRRRFPDEMPRSRPSGGGRKVCESLDVESPGTV